MELQQAFRLWACDPNYAILATKSRDALQRVLMKKYNNVELEQFTAEFCRQLFERSTELQPVKTKAASVLVHILEWGAKNGYCQYPTFNYEIAQTSGASQGASIENSEQRIEKSDGSSVPAGSPSGSSPSIGSAGDGSPKRKGRQPRPIAQIAPDTFEVVKVWPSMSDAERELGACNIDRCAARLSMSAGFYWSFPDDVPTFKERIAAKFVKKCSDKKRIKATINTSNPSPVIPKDAVMPVGSVIPGGSPISFPSASVPADSPVTAALAVFTDKELTDELKRRGWKGNLSLSLSITL